MTLPEPVRQRLQTALPFLGKEAAPLLLAELDRHAAHARIPAKSIVFMEGDACTQIAVLLSGTVRVYKIAETGREITLYRFHQGESCILTANCILSAANFPAMAQVEEEVEAVLIPANIFRNWVRQHDAWRDYVFDLLSRRLSTVMALVDEVAFRRMDARIAVLLLKRNVGSSETIRITHQELAIEIGSSREVVSRILEDFADAGLIQTNRGSVRLLDVPALERKAAMK